MSKMTPSGKNSNDKKPSGLVYLLSDECPARHAEWERALIARRGGPQPVEATDSMTERRSELRDQVAADKPASATPIQLNKVPVRV